MACLLLLPSHFGKSRPPGSLVSFCISKKNVCVDCSSIFLKSSLGILFIHVCFWRGGKSRVLESSLFCFLSGVRACRVVLRRKPSQFWAESVECVWIVIVPVPFPVSLGYIVYSMYVMYIRDVFGVFWQRARNSTTQVFEFCLCFVLFFFGAVSNSQLIYKYVFITNKFRNQLSVKFHLMTSTSSRCGYNCFFHSLEIIFISSNTSKSYC